MKRNYTKKIGKRIVAFVAAAVLTFGGLPLDFVEDMNVHFNLDFSFLDTIFAASAQEDETTEAYTLTSEEYEKSYHSTDGSISVNSAKQLIDLSNVDPEYYANKTIKLAMTTEDLTATTDEGRTFRGLGDSEHPFCGTLQINNTTLTLNTAFFNYISDSAKIEKMQENEPIVTLKSAASDFCFIDNVVDGKNEDDSALVINYFKIENNNNKIKAVINNIGENAKIDLTFTISNTEDTDKSTSDSKVYYPLQIENGSGDAGLICSTMEKNAQLTVSSFTLDDTITDTEVTITSKTGNAGGIVGSMAHGSVLTMKDTFTVAGTVTAEQYAGGLVGSGTDCSIQVEEKTETEDETTEKEVTLTVGGATISGKKASGGVFGSYTKTNEENAVSTDYSKIKIDTPTLSNGTYRGGLIGALVNNGGEVSISKATVSSETSGTTYGGLIGSYSSSALTNTLTVSNVSITANNSSNSGGGVIGTIETGTQTDEQTDGNAYVKLDKVTVTMESQLTAGLIVNAGTGNMLDIGTVMIKGNKLTSGLVDNMTGGVIRLSGTTDLSGISSYASAKDDAQILRFRNGTLVYGVYGWTFNRKTGHLVSDIWSYGEVVRLNSDLTEGGLFTFDETAHTVTVADFDVTNISSKQDFAALSVTVQAKEGSGALQLKNKNTDILSNSITLTGDIDMSGTGVTSITRDDGSQTYSGTFDGGTHTLTLHAGEVYGENVDTTTTPAGAGQIYNHGYVGLFGIIDSATIQNLKLAGEWNVGITNDSNASALKTGVIVAQAKSENKFKCVTVETTQNYAVDSSNDNRYAYIGGFIGYATSSSKLNFFGCTWSGTIENPSTKIKFYNGGYIGYVERSVTVTSTGDTISGTISITSGIGTTQIGGFIGSMQVDSNDSKNTLNTVKISNMTISGANLTEEANNGTTGGFLGYDWYNTNVDINGLTVTGSTLTASGKAFGGLVYQTTGYWSVHDAGITFGTGNSFTGNSGSALLIAKGYDYKQTDKALYLEIGLSSDGTSAYTVSNDVTVTLLNNASFDELVGQTISDDGNGVVSIATPNHALIDQDSCNTYRKQLGTDYNNGKTRYYYNLDAYRTTGDELTLTSNEIDSGTDMLLWSVSQYAEKNIQDLFAKNASNPKISGDIDLKGLSYYPVDISENVTFSNATITFDYVQIQEKEKEADNKQLSDSNKQHYMMQCGLFGDATASTSNISIKADGLTLSGTLGANSKKSGSGALVSGTAQGTYDTTKGASYVLTLSLKNVTLNGVKIYGTTGKSTYAPLLISQIGSYSTLSVDGLEQENYVSGEGEKVATSLIGKVGSETATGINLDFKNIALASKDDETNFSRATLLESFQYADNCSGTYNFNKDDTKVTYGQELSNTENSDVSGRNNNAQYYYYDDQETTICSVLGGADADETTYFATGYLRYVNTVEGTATNYHELDINQPWADLLEGCGTYGDPYLITSGTQLLTVQKILKGQSGNSEVQVDKAIYNSIISTETTFTGSGNTDYHTDSSTANHETMTVNKVEDSTAFIQYIANAYYEITENITLDGSFTGIGEKDDLSHTFSGVIFGADSTITITITTPDDATYTYGGLVRYASGCVIKDLQIEYAENDEINMQYLSGSDVKRSNDSFFGGVIGYAIAGDNIVDNVNITSYPKLVQNDNYNLISVGGYVGMVGGGSGDATDAMSNGGGVVFRNISNEGLKNGLDNENYYYTNPYVGRVLDGYVCTESELPTDNGSNYKIPVLAGGDTLSISGTTITVSTSQQLWVLSAIVNSGAGAQGEARDTTHSNAYSYGKVRTGNYANMGEEENEAVTADLADETYWGGVENTDSGKQSYLIAKYVSGDKANAAQLTNNSSAYTLEFKADIDMTSYGNGFRGVGAAYQDNSNAYTMYRTLPLCTITGNNHTITLNRQVLEYKNETWWVQSLGLFPTVNFKKGTSNPAVSYLTISGDVTIEYYHTDDTSGINYNFIGECSAGGFAGMTVNGCATEETTITNLYAQKLKVTGAKYAGGFFAVVGQSSRTNRSDKTFLSTISTKVKNYTFTSCGYQDVEIRGRYSAGGFLSVYNGSGSLTISGKSVIDGEKNIIRLTYDAADDIATWTSASSSDAMGKGFTGAGAIIGNCQNTFTVNSAADDELTVKNTEITAPRIRNNTDYGVGGIIGLANNTVKVTVNHVKMTGCVIKTDTEDYDGYTFVGKFTNDTSYFLTIPIGGICGQTGEFSLNDINISDTQILNSGYIGGMIGCMNKNKDCEIKESTMSNVCIYTQGVHSFDGFSMAGGICGKPSAGTITISNCTLNDVDILSDGYAGGIAGALRSNLSLSGVEITGCNIATNCIGFQSNAEVGTYVFGDSQTNPKSTIKNGGTNMVRSDTSAVSENACAGGIVGNYTKRSSVESIKGYNVLMKDNIIGYYVTDGTLADKVAAKEYDSVRLGINNIAVMDSDGNYVTYDKAKFTTSESYTNGNDGIIVGDITESGKQQNICFVGLSVINTTGGTPYDYIGNNNNTTTTSSYYVIRSDYTNQATSASEVTTVPSDIFNVYEKAASTKPQYTLSSDGAALTNGTSIASKIYTDMTAGDSTTLNQTYHQVSDLKGVFGTDGAKLTTFKNVDTDATYTGSDFPVLVIDTNKDSEINTLVRQYVSLLTDWDQVADTEWSSLVKEVKLQSYQWNGSKFINVTSTLTYDTSSKEFSLSSKEKHDNGNGKSQFTLIRIKYNNGDYYLYIPVYVRKVLEYEVSTIVKAGTDYYSSAYADATSTALANHGEPITALIRFTYKRDKATWQTYMEGGDNLLGNFNKTVLYDSNNSLPIGTDLILLDANEGGRSQAFYATHNGTTVSFNDFADSGGTSWEPVPLCTLLGVEVDEEPDFTDTSIVLFQKLPDSTDATVMVGEDYYGSPKMLKNIMLDNEIEDTPASISELNELLADTNTTYARLVVGTEGQLDEEDYFYEEYYLTIQTPSSTKGSVLKSSVAANDQTLGTMLGVSTSVEVPTHYVETSSEYNKNYIIGDVYTQNVEISSEDEELVTGDAASIEATVTTTIKADSVFKDYIRNDANASITHGLDFDLILYQTSSHVVTTFDTHTSVTITSYSVDDEKSSENVNPSSKTATLVSFDALNTNLRNKITENETVVITATMQFDIGDAETQFENAYRDTTGASQTGIAIRVNSKLGTAGSYFKQYATTTQHFYVEEQKQATLSYNAVKDSSFGGTSSLGINPYELEEEGSQSVAIIDSNAIYDLSNIMETMENYNNKELTVQYKLTLYQKSEDGSYVSVNISDYLSNVTLDGKDMESDTDGRYYFVNRAWDNSKTSDSLNIQFSVKTGGAFEQENLYYSNYKVLLEAQISDDKNVVVEGTHASDYIIYTNARILLELVEKE